jgi:phage shock protein C
MKKLRRSSKDNKICGVCGGIAEFFGVDVTIVRILFLLFTLAGGSGILLYIAMAIIMPKPADESDKEDEKDEN